MSEQELINFIIQERINKALVKVQKSNKKSKEENEKLLKAERVMDNLPKSQKKHIDFYINSYVSCMALREVELYKKGFTDGVKTIQLMNNL